MNNDQLCLSICKRLKNTCRMYIHDTKSIYRRYKEYLQTMQKVLPTIQKKYLQTIQKVFANDTKSICRRYGEPTRRDDNPRSGVCVHNRLPRGRSVFWFVERPFACFLVYFVERPFVCFPRVFFCNPGKNVYILVYRLPPQFLVVRQSLLFAV